jgi:hypothetical protein
MRQPAALKIAGLILGVGLFPLPNTWADDWSRFRGPSGGGIAAGTLPADPGFSGLTLFMQAIAASGNGLALRIEAEGDFLISGRDGGHQRRHHRARAAGTHAQEHRPGP